VSVVVTVDCGTTAFAPLTAGVEIGLDVIVVDHHVAELALPPAVAIVNPNRLDEPSGFGQLAAVGVAFLLVVGVNRGLRAAGCYGAERPEPDLLQWLDLVALGTICDVVPLTGLSRALVVQGLKVLARRSNPGLAALADVAALAERPTAYHAGFVLGPRVNAGGRVGQSDLGARLLSTQDAGEAAAIAAQLDAYNRERRAIEQRVLEEAIAAVERGPTRTPLLFVAGTDWHPGVIGIVASRLKERYSRPACVVALEGGGGDCIGKGSGRSVRGFDLGNAIIAARQAGLLVNGGGHAMAAGFTVAGDRLDALNAFLLDRIGDVPDGAVVPTLEIDGALQPGAATLDFLAAVERLGPFGSGNAEPRFAMPGVRVIQPERVNGGHLRCAIAGPDGARLKAVAFRCAEGPLAEALSRAETAPVHLAGRLCADRWQGRTRVQFEIEDAAPAYAG
jgi:single-stranded-DNA-specific exonuclease